MSSWEEKSWDALTGVEPHAPVPSQSLSRFSLSGLASGCCPEQYQVCLGGLGQEGGLGGCTKYGYSSSSRYCSLISEGRGSSSRIWSKLADLGTFSPLASPMSNYPCTPHRASGNSSRPVAVFREARRPSGPGGPSRGTRDVRIIRCHCETDIARQTPRFGHWPPSTNEA